MKTRALGLLAVAFTILAVAPAWAFTSPTPLGPEIDLSADDASAEGPAVAHFSGFNGSDSFIVVWKAHDLDGDSIRARYVVTTGGEAVPSFAFTVRAAQAGVMLSAPAVAWEAGRLTIVWGEARQLQSCVMIQRYGPRPLPPSLAQICTPGSTSELEAPQVAAGANAGGEVAIAWTRRVTAERHRLLLRTYPLTGAARPIATVAAEAGSNPRPRVAVGGGQVFVVWSNPVAMLRRFAIAGTPLGSASPLPAYGGHGPAVASNRNGQFASVWGEGGATDGSSFIGGWIFNPDGSRQPRGFLDPLDYDALEPDGDVFNPDIASDRVGGLAFIWESELYDAEETAIVGRVYNSLGDELTPIFRVNLEEAGAQKHPAVTLADDGTFLVAWETPGSDGHPGQEVHAAVLRMPHDDDPCVYRGNTFLCEFLGNFILAAPIQFGTGIANGDRPLLGDLDGDGRADPCLRRGNQFLCDLLHNGGSAEKKINFGPPGAPALLADANGDGTADPCVRPGTTFLCDTAHDGGTAEFTENLGVSTDVPLAGDVNGDGRTDLCVFRAATKAFLCDTAHDGSLGLNYRVNAKPGDRPLLGDVDGDGRADFCLARGAKLWCDRHTGVLELRSLSTKPNDWLLLGNVDGM